MIKATINTKGVERMMRTATKQVRYAAALALSEAAEDYQKVATVLMRQALDRPIPFTQRGLKHTRATASKLQASVFMLPRQASYMHWQVYGGVDLSDKPLPTKPSEDVYGNLPKGAVKTKNKVFTVYSEKYAHLLTFKRVRSGKKPTRRRSASYRGKGVSDRWRGLKLIAGQILGRRYKPLYPFYERAHSRIPVIVRRVFIKHLQSALGGARW